MKLSRISSSNNKAFMRGAESAAVQLSCGQWQFVKAFNRAFAVDLPVTKVKVLCENIQYSRKIIYLAQL